MPIRTLLDSPYLVVTLDEQAGVVRALRLETPFVSTEDAVQHIEPAFVLIGQASGPRRHLLMDLRRGPGRNEAAFERAIVPLLMRHLRGFARIAVVVQTAVGRLQIQRIAREMGRDGLDVFLSEEEALAYLRWG